ncbi:MAG: ATP-binding protein [Thiogranum sp.]
MRLGLYPRMVLSVGTLLCAALITLGYLLLNDSEQRFREERLELARAQARTLAEGSLDALISGDYELLERWVAAVLPADYYAWAYLARADGRILTDTRLERVGHYAGADGPISSPRVRGVEQDGRRLREIIYPAWVGDQHIANAVIAYYLDEQPFYTRTAALKTAAVLGLFLVLLLVAIAFIIRRHTRPLSTLTRTITGTSLSAVPARRPDPDILERSDEIGTLAREYDELLDRLQASYAELRDEEHRLRDMVALRTRRLQQINRELETFSYSVSHDLRAPLRAINGFCQALLEDYAGVLDATGRDHLNRALRASERMSDLIDDLLRLSRVSRSALNRQPVDLSALVREVLAKLQEQEPGRTLETDITPDLTADGDPALLGILIDNLVGNAWKYTATTERPRIEFGVAQVDGESAWYIRDNGAGFDMQYGDKLFVPFQRLHRSEDFEGTGIGLATAQRIVHRHNGRIWAEGRVDEGATFYFTLGSEDAGMISRHH